MILSQEMILFTTITCKRRPKQSGTSLNQNMEKIMVWLAMSPKGVSSPYFVPSGLVVNQEVYLNECIKKRLEPMIKKYYSSEGYAFLQDLASSHYANLVQEYLVKKKYTICGKN